MRHLIHISLAILALLALSGWSWDQKPRAFGDSFRMQLNAQKVNPEPRIAPDAPVEGINGRVAADAMEGYRAPDPKDKGPSFADAIESLMDTEK
ncbi:hypothetical protein [Desulfovibrio ferrophilus]|uniref:Uncharacterized protein n=1 Tax=Desulfovibrio ferrophilus TaxID=241368 RepID=A0A2Z6AXY1_9BACT|nr:hypothetical protein [Desulfovibrio ferrophilus]BBD08122.1 uncharacterized protein DFE_1396 [Desulfovibrio ferrophilus]